MMDIEDCVLRRKKSERMRTTVERFESSLQFRSAVSACSKYKNLCHKWHVIHDNRVNSILRTSPQGNIFSFRQLNRWSLANFLSFLIIALILFSNMDRTFAQSDRNRRQADGAIPYPDNVFIEKLIDMYGDNDTLTVKELDDLLSSIRNSKTSERNNHSKDHHQKLISDDPSVADNGDGAVLQLERCNRSSSKWKNSSVCLTDQCLDTSALLSLYSLPSTGSYSREDLYRLSPALLYQGLLDLCQQKQPERTKHYGHKPANSATWGYGFLFVSIINVCSLGGVIVLPFMKTTVYKQVLMFMVGLAVGSLAGSGLLFLIPQAFNLVTDEGHSDYLWKATTIMGGIYLFFLVERFLKLLMEIKKRKKFTRANIDINGSEDSENENEKENWAICSVKARTPHCVSASAHLKDLDPNLQVPNTGVCLTLGQSQTMSRENSLTDITEDMSNGVDLQGVHVTDSNGLTAKMIDHHDHGKREHMLKRQQSEIATVAWMVIFGDGLHNFIDGLSIGAAFTESILSGVSVSVAVICEELPHELAPNASGSMGFVPCLFGKGKIKLLYFMAVHGDFAILLNSGMSLKKALFYNFMSACMCYFGLVAGIVLGQNTTAHDWIFALAGGMFLYISLVDMLPEMNSAAEEEERKNKTVCSGRAFILQNSGILIGYSLLLTMAIYGHMIDFD